MDLSVLPNNNHPDKFLQLEVKSLEKNSAFLRASWAKFPEAALPGVQRWHNRIYLQPVTRTRTYLLQKFYNQASALLRDLHWLDEVSKNFPKKGEGGHVPSPFADEVYPVCGILKARDLSKIEKFRKIHPYMEREKRTVTELPGLDLNRVSQEIIDKSLEKHITPITLKSAIKSNPLYSDIHAEDDWEEKKKTPSWTVQDYDRQSLHSNLASHIKENPNDLKFWMGDIYTPGYDTLLKKKEKEKKHSKYCRIILLMVLAVCILITVITLSVLLT